MFDADDLGVADAVEVLHQRADRVAVRGDDQALAAPDRRRHGVVPARHHARDGVLQAFGQRHLRRRELGVAQVAAFAARIVGVEQRRRHVVAAAPDQHLLVAVLLGHVGLVQALQRAVVALVQAPVVLHRQPGAVHHIERMPQRPDGALQHRGHGEVELVAGLLEQAPRLARLRHAGVGQRHIGPAGEAVLEVPGRFAVADEDELVHGRRKGLRRARIRMIRALCHLRHLLCSSSC